MKSNPINGMPDRAFPGPIHSRIQHGARPPVPQSPSPSHLATHALSTRRRRRRRTHAPEMKKIFGAKKSKDPPPSIQDATERVFSSSRPFARTPSLLV